MVTKIEEILLKDFQSVSKQETDPTMCYLRLNVRCSSGIRLSLRFRDRFSTVVYVRDWESMQCVEVPCTANGRLPEDTLIFGNQITLSPPDLDLISTFTVKDECQTARSNDEDSSVTVSCNEQTDVETQGQYYTYIVHGCEKPTHWFK